MARKDYLNLLTNFFICSYQGMVESLVDIMMFIVYFYVYTI